MPLAIIVAVVVVVAGVLVVLIAVRILLHLRRAGRSEFEYLLLEGPSQTGIIGGRRDDGFIDVLGAIVEITLQMLAVPVDEGEIIRLHALAARIGNLIAIGVAITGGLQANGGAGLLEGPRAAADVRFSRRSTSGPLHGVRLCRSKTSYGGQGRGHPDSGLHVIALHSVVNLLELECHNLLGDPNRLTESSSDESMNLV